MPVYRMAVQGRVGPMVVLLEWSIAGAHPQGMSHTYSFVVVMSAVGIRESGWPVRDGRHTLNIYRNSFLYLHGMHRAGTGQVPRIDIHNRNLHSLAVLAGLLNALLEFSRRHLLAQL